jgi:hypothetical protein
MIRVIAMRSLCALVGGAGAVIVVATLMPTTATAIVLADAIIRLRLGG